MPSKFEEITRVVVQEMDSRGDMIAVRSLIDADRFHCFCLVREKRNFLGCRYYTTDLTLEDILEREEGEGLFDKPDAGLQGQYELGEMASQEILPTPTPAYSQLPIAINKINQLTNKLQNLYVHIHTHQFKKCTEVLHGEKGTGEVEINFF